jgi:hypothetical protein
MRITYGIAVAAALALSACGGGGEAPKAEDKAPEKMADGLYEVTSEVIDLSSTDKTTPATKLKKGDTQVVKACVANGKPAPDMFAEAGDKCETKNDYVRYGRLSAQLSCKRGSLSGEVMPAMMGSYTADGFEGDISTLTYFVKDGDYRMLRKVTGKRIGDCPVALNTGEELNQ